MDGGLEPTRITRAVVSAAGRPTALDTDRLPKTLIDIEGESLISHVLRQLHGGGIQHVVVMVSHHGPAIVAELEDVRESLPDLQIQVADLGTDYKGFYAKSLLAARQQLFASDGEPGLLIATSDHILDETLIEDMCHVQLTDQQTEACVLADFSTKPFIGLPETSVAVRCMGDMRVAELSRALARPIVQGARCSTGVGIEAGLFACTRSIFDKLEKLSETQEYFTLTEALQELALGGLVTCLATAGRRWVAVETTEELEGSRRIRVPTAHTSRRVSSCPSNASDNTPFASPGSATPLFLLEPVPVFFIGGDTKAVLSKSK